MIFITLDGARFDRLSNSKVIKELAKKGSCFTNVITYSPYTIGAMHAIFSGEYGFRTGVNSYWSTYRFKHDRYKTLTEYFHDAGYKTYGDSINELVLPKQGFDELKYHDEDKDDLIVRHVKLINKMKSLVQQNQKFFLYLHYSNIHTNIKHAVLKPYNNFSEEYFKNRNINEKKYDEYFECAENYLKNIMKQINKNGLEKNSMVVIVSDHGISVGEKFGERAYGAFCYDYTIRTFGLFIKEGIFPIKKIDIQTRSIDFLPTILQACNISQDENYEKISGKTLQRIIEGKDTIRSAITETGNPQKSNRPPKEPNIVSIRKEGWKLILNLFDKSQELYNLHNDPNEEHNLINDNNINEERLFDELMDLYPNLREKWMKKI